jgi:hypothetical protein
LAVGPLDYDQTKFRELNATGTAFNFYEPSPNHQFVITGMRIKANRSVSATVDAEIIIYEASSVDSIVVDKTLHEEALIRGEGANLFPVRILVAEGQCVNAKTSDASVFITILGFFIDAGP